MLFVQGPQGAQGGQGRPGQLGSKVQLSDTYYLHALWRQDTANQKIVTSQPLVSFRERVASGTFV